jgi:diguanylate cyclase (GGDEF)-like protein
MNLPTRFHEDPKNINDTYGHPAGDAVLQQLGNRLVSTFPRKTDFSARYGGEEFCILLHNARNELGQRLGERLLHTVRGEEFSYQDYRIPVTVSIGVAELIPGETVASWVARADRALYRAKDSGRDQLCLAIETAESV